MQVDNQNPEKAPFSESLNGQTVNHTGTMQPRILMVDDDGMLLEFYEAALSFEYEVLIASNIGTAQRLLEDQLVDAVACDLHLEGESGLDLLGWIKAHHPRLLRHTMILSGDPDPEPGGFNVRVLGKPMDVAHLRQAVATLLDY